MHGVKPVVCNYSVSQNGFTLLKQFKKCLHDGYFALIDETTVGFNATSKDCQRTKKAVHLSQGHLAALSNMETDKTWECEFFLLHEAADWRAGNALSKLAALVQSNGQASITDVLQDTVQSSNVPNITSAVTKYRHGVKTAVCYCCAVEWQYWSRWFT